MLLSYSKLNTYQQCPLRYRFTYLDRLPRRPRRLFRMAKRVTTRYDVARLRPLGAALLDGGVADLRECLGPGRAAGDRRDARVSRGDRAPPGVPEANIGRPCAPAYLSTSSISISDRIA